MTVKPPQVQWQARVVPFWSEKTPALDAVPAKGNAGKTKITVSVIGSAKEPLKINLKVAGQKGRFA